MTEKEKKENENEKVIKQNAFESKKKKNQRKHWLHQSTDINYFDLERRRVAASDLKAISESFDKTLSLAEPTTRQHRIICTSMGSLLAIPKNRVVLRPAAWLERVARMVLI